MFKILIVDDDVELVSTVKELLERSSYDVVTAYSGNEAIDKLLANPDVSIALVDLVMPLMDGFELTDKLLDINQSLEIIIITAHGTVPTAVEAIKRGASDFITKPYDKELLLKKIETIKNKYELKNELNNLKKIVSDKYGFEEIITKSRLMKHVFQKASSAANNSANVFIIGETGTGKGILAKSIHLKSSRSVRPFVSINCGAIPKELLESELFGHKKGSFTGAVRDHDGLFVSANGGTIFLDEIGEMPKELQVSLLRVLEDGKVRPVGGTQEISTDTRVIAATNRAIDKLKNNFLREDLFYRLAVIVIELPPLRERREDIPLLVENFIAKFNKKYSKNFSNLTSDAFNFLNGYEFPGNIRELENLLEGIIAISPDKKVTINMKDVSSHLLWKGENESKYALLKLENIEKYTLQQALRESRGNKSKAARLLGISRDTLYRKIRHFGI